MGNFQRQPSPGQGTRVEFEEEFTREVLSGVFSSCKQEQWRDAQKWMNEVRKFFQEGEPRLEAREWRRMGEVDGHSHSR